MKEKLDELLCSGKKRLTEEIGKMLAAAAVFLDQFSKWYESQEESIQELTSVILALAIAILLRIIIVHS